VDLVHTPGRQTARLVRAIEVGEHLRVDLRHRHLAERWADIALVDQLVPVHGVRRPTLASQFGDPLGVELVDGGGCSGAAALADLDEQLGSSPLGVAQGAVKCATHLTAAARDRIASSLDDQLPRPQRPLAHPRRSSQLSHRRTVPDLG
jgi:hypothetical protein